MSTSVVETPIVETSLTFRTIGTAVAKQFKSMSSTGLFLVDINKDVLWATYLGSFPPGTNPIYKQRSEHDCQCCRSFIRTLGSVVSIVNGRLVTIWDINVGGPYQVVANAMAELVRQCKIENVFLHTEPTVGVAKSRQLLEDKSVTTWEHFFVHLPNWAVVNGEDKGTKLGQIRTTVDVLSRSLKEISMDSIDAVLEMIAQNSLYRGEENKFAVESFRKLKIQYDKTPEDQKELFTWASIPLQSIPVSVTHIRNTAIGTLLVDLSEGKDMEDAVKSFEAKVAPTNYKRPTALITKAMIQKAQEKIEELGFSTALERRYATIDDITVNNILFANREAKKEMNVFDQLAASVPVNTKKLDRVEEVSIDDFLSKILPKATSVEVMFENKHSGNLVSLIAPVDPTAKNMFKWPNNFSWSYAGEMTDSIKERVKKAGGSVEGDLCCRLAWDYTDDLDFHMTEPNGYKIYYPNKRQKSSCGGLLDLDANGGDGICPDPAENIYYPSKHTMKEGVYKLAVNNYNRRSDGKGFEVEIEFEGQRINIAYDSALRTNQTIEVARIRYDKVQGFSVIESLPSTQTSKGVWNLPTQTFHKVNILMLSPNHWDEKAVGNKHYFFMLEGCLNDGKARGFFNEFLVESLAPHRKVFEVVGAKMKTDTSDRQLSGLGFSSTQRNHLLCKVEGAFSRVVKINF